MTHHFIVLDNADNYSRETYGILYKSRNVFDTTVSHGPTRLVVWDNTVRVNPDRGKQLGETLTVGDRRGNRVTEYNRRYTEGTYLDPRNAPTDALVSILLTPEASAITSNGTNTGTVASGQVYASGRLADGDTATLSYPHGLDADAILHFPKHHNGHGFVTLKG